ncbi:Nucleolar GTP-binding protein 1 [Brettanomyces bruxellensis]|uniref:Nucleolar GTP-binding protein 1 n=2 Tax=Dekkera bruxellensis TaxID=5007 RepID=A0A3F2Y9E5_DEKBR|nr:Nucleolar GTP-binding protein 1 [Brettanomyces bruxellensis]KAF6012735.1 Nucleolar GTP-binding protein 1 [Brettanomyces bruxellensis]VUG19800.1 NOG1 [Brettanomyces bruxellensis]
MQLTWKNIPAVPEANDLLDIVLNRTQRQTPTIIRQGFKITRIRAFYMRKVKFTAEGFVEKFDAILQSFPNINDLHPFHRDLMDTLYEKNHYKVSLASVSKAKTLIEKISRDYVRLLKFGQSLFQCKELKRAGLGRMATVAKKLKDPLAYLEQVRQHLGRLPSIDPSTRTLVICGYPNVGKSSFLRSVTKADVDVQPYAFTTKSLYVGHFDYKYLRFQVIDTPGILDRPTEEMNNIEMQSIYAIAHLRSCILYFMDLSEQCGFSIEDQVKLYNSIKPLFANKSVLIVANKADIIRVEDLDEDRQQLVKSMLDVPGAELVQASCYDQENVMPVRNKACEKLLASRMEQKLKGAARVSSVLNKIHVSKPQQRDDVERPACIPDAVKSVKKYDPADPDRPKLARDIEVENGGPGVYNVDLKAKYLLEEDEWKKDVMPEVLDGKNVYDYLDPDIAEKLQALEREEEQLEKEGFYDSDDDDEANAYLSTPEAQEIREKAEWIRNKQKTMINDARQRKSLNNRAILPRSKLTRSYKDMESHMHKVGHDTSVLSAKKDSQHREPKVSGADIMRASMISDANSSALQPVGKSDRLHAGVNDGMLRSKAERIAKLSRRARNLDARVGESDRRIYDEMPKHLNSGKRGIGKTQRR